MPARTSRTCSSSRPTRLIRPATCSMANSLAFETRTEEITGEGRRARPAGGPAHGPRTDPQRRREAPRRCAAHEPALACHRGPDRTFEAILAAQHRGARSKSSARASRCTARRARTSSTPTSTATSATSCPARSRSATATRPVSGRAPATARTSGRAASRSTSCPRRSTRGGHDRDGQQCDRGRVVPVLRRRPVGSGLPGGAAAEGCWRAARTA